MTLRQLDWQSSLKHLPEAEQAALDQIMPSVVRRQKAILRDASSRAKLLENALSFRSLVKSRELMITLSLHLSSHGDGFGAFSSGWLYSLKPTVNRSAPYTLLDTAMQTGSTELSLLRDTLRPNKLKTWQS